MMCGTSNDMLHAASLMRYSMKPSKHLFYKCDREIIQNQTTQGGEFYLKFSVRSTLRLTPAQSLDGRNTFSSAYQRCTMHINAPVAGMTDTTFPITPISGCGRGER